MVATAVKGSRFTRIVDYSTFAAVGIGDAEGAALLTHVRVDTDPVQIRALCHDAVVCTPADCIAYEYSCQCEYVCFAWCVCVCMCLATVECMQVRHYLCRVWLFACVHVRIRGHPRAHVCQSILRRGMCVRTAVVWCRG